MGRPGPFGRASRSSARGRFSLLSPGAATGVAPGRPPCDAPTPYLRYGRFGDAVILNPGYGRCLCDALRLWSPSRRHDSHPRRGRLRDALSVPGMAAFTMPCFSAPGTAVAFRDAWLSISRVATVSELPCGIGR
ncbi:hypothetical protein GCM10010116_54450 [Microbispora rosea subsp. aerata]|nr:hypothetical protein GCM10010116_54450 [Microbispora rosea subsp. aerata]